MIETSNYSHVLVNLIELSEVTHGTNNQVSLG